MHTQWSAPIQYSLKFQDASINLNALLGQKIRLQHTGRIICHHCQQLTKKSYSQGYCYVCFSRLAQCDLCIVKPHTCHYAAGTCRDKQWAEQFCFQEHYVYLANSSGLKVGITRQPQLITRWIDQGATQGLAILKVNSRYLAGLCEMLFARFVSDKTQWQRMLKGKAEPIDLLAKRQQLLDLCHHELHALSQQFGNHAIHYVDDSIVALEFPIIYYAEKINALNLDKTPLIEGRLHGIKGQYLMLDCGVINSRKYTGYEVLLTTVA